MNKKIKPTNSLQQHGGVSGSLDDSLRLSRRYSAAALLVALTWLSGCGAEGDSSAGNADLVNLAHLNHLYEEIVVDSTEMAIIHIYSEYPDYAWVDASGEGVACVDDVARAAVVYLRHFETRGDNQSLMRAQKLLEFCRYMQADDGQFYNFVFADYSINRHGKTSFKSMGWWASRAVWALGEGCRVFADRDSAYASVLERHIEKTFAHIDTLLDHYPDVQESQGFKAPQWLLYNSAADATSELMLGLAAYAQASDDKRARAYLQKFAEGVSAMQLGNEKRFPFGAMLSWRNTWHGWGNSQSQALAAASQVLQDETIATSAVLEATGFYPFWIREGFPREMAFRMRDSVEVETRVQFDQIAYAVRPMVVASVKLHDLTRQPRFATTAAELASWFFGNNPAGQQMYDPATGRCFDGILSETEINRNSGAESTIEALYAIIELDANHDASAALRARLVDK